MRLEERMLLARIHAARIKNVPKRIFPILLSILPNIKK
jgi:hypothetical protein